MNTNKLLKMLLEVIDYSFLQTDGSYNKILTYPVRDKIQYIKEQLKDAKVKEVDLKKELESWRHNHFHGRRDKEASGEYLERVSQLDLAKHFFELGLLSTITEEDCKLIWNIGDSLSYMPEENFFKELLRRYKAQKGE